jgi:hypothetical protein
MGSVAVVEQTVARRHPILAGLAFASFGLIWGGSAVLAWHQWSVDAAWWAREAPVASRELVASDRHHMLLDAVLTTIAGGLLAAAVVAAGVRRGLARAAALSGCFAALGFSAWIFAALSSFDKDGPQPYNCAALSSVPEGGGWTDQAWSWTEFGDVVVVFLPGGQVERVTC